ncbi:MAG: hypothetical protein WC864_07515 [Ilumatobacteraceae bacterium]
MAKLLHCMNTSLDGYIEDSAGGIDWSEPTEQVHTFINDLLRPAGTYLFGRRMYEMMDFWETAHSLPDIPGYMLDFADVYLAADKVVFSTTLQSVSRDRT